jgi:MFS family permease
MGKAETTSEVGTGRVPSPQAGAWKSTAAPVLLLGVLFLGYLVYSADRYVLNTLLTPIQGTLHLTGFEVGLLGAAIYGGVLSTVFIAGHLSDRYGRWPVVILGLAVFTAFTWLIGFSSDFAEAFTFRLVSGMGEGIFWPVAMAAVATYFSQRKGLTLGIFYVGFDIGGVVGTSVAGLVFYLASDWRQAFFVAPSIGLIAIAGALYAKRRFPWSEEDSQRIKLGKDAVDLLRRRGTVTIMVFALLATWATVWQPVFLVYYFNKVMNIGVTYAALLATPVLAAGALGKISLGSVSDRWRRDRLLVAVTVATLLSYAVFFESNFLLVNELAALSMGFFSSSIFPVMQALAVDQSQGRPGTTLGLTTTAQSIATILAPSTTGAMFALGVGRAVALEAMIPAVLTVAVALFLKEPRIKSRKASEMRSE